jgi:hypothetical protein
VALILSSPYAHPFFPPHVQVTFDIEKTDKGLHAVNVRDESGKPFERAQRMPPGGGDDHGEQRGASRGSSRGPPRERRGRDE